MTKASRGGAYTGKGKRTGTPGHYKYVYHTAGHHNVPGIAHEGLQPRGKHSGTTTFNHGGYAENSDAHVFFAAHPEAAREWMDKVHALFENASDDVRERIPVLLRAKRSKVEGLKTDEIGERDVTGSLKTAKGVDPKHLEYWHPVHKDWRPLSTWGDDTGHEHGIRETEVEDGEELHYEYDSLDEGGFKPSPHDEEAYSAPSKERERRKEAEKKKAAEEKKRAAEAKKRAAAERGAYLKRQAEDKAWGDEQWKTVYSKDPAKRKSVLREHLSGKFAIIPGWIPPRMRAALKVDEAGKPLEGHPLEA